VKVNISTSAKKFAQCNNSKCRIFFLFDPRVLMGESGFLCPSCRDKMDTHHAVQCTCCQSIVDFIEAEPSEEPIIFYVEKCSRCHGTVEDEKHMVPFYYPDAFV